MWQGYIKSFATIVLTIILLPALCFAAQQKNLFIEGQDYIKLPDTVRNNPEVEQLLLTDPHKVQVLFFFSYGCHGCEMFHTPFEAWAAQELKNHKNKVAVYIYPVSFNAQWKMLAKMYYVMDSLDPDEKLNGPIFTAIHKQGLKLWDPAVMKKFFIQHGYTAEQFDQAYNSFGVNRKVKRADDLAKGYSIVVTPDIVVNGPVHSYKVDLGKAGNDIPKLIKILDYLVEKESKLL